MKLGSSETPASSKQIQPPRSDQTDDNTCTDAQVIATDTADTTGAANAAVAIDTNTLPELQRHTLFEDLQGLLTGTLFVALGLIMFKQAGLMTGGTVGLAFLAHYASDEPFGPLLFLINLPFYILAWQRMGRRFTLKTMAAVSMLSVLSEQLPDWLVLQQINPLFAAIGGGLLVGAGFIVLFRHQASLGGLNIVAQWCQEKLGWRAGIVQLGMDAGILLMSWPWINSHQLALSVLAAVAMNFALAVNHKPGRYTAF